jgi:leucyl/phenylalanyl-tRNA--protein transferase
MPANSPLTPEILLNGYASGVFPMADSADDDQVYWVQPKIRGVMPLDGFHTSRSLKRAISKRDYTVSFDTQFEDVVRACADREETWINSTIFDLYCQLFQMGFAHSIEINHEGKLIGGVYGVTLGAAFFGESMFSRATNGSKIALALLVDHLNAKGFKLFDTQFQNDHIKTLGCIEMPQADYLKLLENALQHQATF